MAVMETLFCLRSVSIWSPPYVGPRICFGRRPSNLRLLQGFRVRVSEQLLVSQNKSSENAVKEESREEELFSPNALKSSAPLKYSKVESEILFFLKSEGLSDSQAEKLISKLYLCVQLAICELHASRRVCTFHEIASEIKPFIKSLLTKEAKINGGLLSDINYLMEELNLVKVKPYIDLLTEIGGTKQIITNIILKFPPFFGLDISNDISPIMSLLLNYGVNKQRLAKVVERMPQLFKTRKEHVETVLNYLHGLGLPIDRVGKAVESFPSILRYNTQNLQTKVDYFLSLGVDLSKFVSKNPQSLALNLEKNIKPVTKFFMDKGFTKEEFSIIISRYPRLYGRSMEKGIIPKWEFFEKMGYEKSVLVTYPNYFSYSLEKRIRPRYERMVEAAVRLPFHYLSNHGDETFEKLFEKCVRMQGSVGDDNTF